MSSEISKYIDAIKLIHGRENFWIFDQLGNNIYINSSKKYELQEIKFYYAELNGIFGWNELFIQLQQTKKWDNVGIEAIGVFKDASSEAIGVLFEIIPLYHLNDIIGFFMLSCGNLANFEYAHIISNLLFANTRRMLEIEITLRELEIVYFIIRGRTYDEIAEILSDIHGKAISSSCVGKIVRNSLYDKFNVWNKFDLKQVLLKSNFVNKIPSTIYQALLNQNQLDQQSVINNTTQAKVV
ncbi:MAG: hypothetical protein KBD37_10040 [Burkholderiales bacterium]|nr:hypothetical protein [Burkholderiales bacterium]